MTDPIEIKSIGFLIDEWITACFKSDTVIVSEVELRRNNLRNAIDARLSNQVWSYGDTVQELKRVSKQCWDAQDTIMNADFWHHEKIAIAARIAQKTNAQRNALIRKIDEEFGDKERSPLGKTYA